MQPLDLSVITKVNEWLGAGRTVWVCTVMATWGSSPREPGSLFAACNENEHIGSLSGGCVEDNFLTRLAGNEFNHEVQIVTYGSDAQANINLPCGGILDVLVEKIAPTPENREHFSVYLDCLSGREVQVREIDLNTGRYTFTASGVNTPATDWQRNEHKVSVRVGPARRLIIAGYSPVAEFCARYAVSLGFEVIFCEHREEERQYCNIEGCWVESQFAADFILQPNAVHSHTAIVALTHDPRIDDLTMMEAVTTNAFYIGVMGSKRTSAKRAARLKTTAQLNEQELERIHMPVGLDIGSKTPAEIGLAVMADVIRAYRQPADK